MITLTLQVDAESYQKFHDRAVARKVPVETVIQQHLRATMHVPVGTKYLIMEQDDLVALEGILGGGSLLNSGDLRRKVERLAGISFHHVRLPFTPNQLEELAHRAERLSLTSEQLIERIGQKLYEQFFQAGVV